MRMDIKNITNELSAQHAEQERNAGVSFLEDTFNLMRAYNVILEYCKATKTRPQSHAYSMVNGCLHIDGVLIERIANLINKPGYARAGAFIPERGIDYERLILSRQEGYDGLF